MGGSDQGILMQVRSAVKVELDPTRAQRSKLAACAGTARYVYNRALNQSIEHYEQAVLPAQVRGEKIFGLSVEDLCLWWTKEQYLSAPWLRQSGIPSEIAQQAIRNLGRAFKNFFEHGRGYPKLKVHGQDEHFQVPRVKLDPEHRRVKLASLPPIKMKQNPSERLDDCEITSASVSERAGHWFVSFSVKKEVSDVETVSLHDDPANLRVVGVDLGIDTYAQFSDGHQVVTPGELKKVLPRLRRHNQDCARKRNVRDGVKTARMKKREAHQAAQRGERYWPTQSEKRSRKEAAKLKRERLRAQKKTPRQEYDLACREARLHKQPLPELPVLLRPEIKSRRLIRAELELAKAYYLVACRRGNFQHNLSTKTIVNYDVLVLEGLHIAGLLKNHKLARSIADMAWAEFRRQLIYKASWSGKLIILADRWFASSQICSRCGHRKIGEDDKLKLSDRVYHCDQCGLNLDRDLNAARNLRNYGLVVMATTRGGSRSPALAAWQQAVNWQDPASRKSASSAVLSN
jgi:IS605 OrfB family transposase